MTKWTQKKEFGNFYVEQSEDNSSICLLTLNDNENKFNNVNLKHWNDALDYVESIEDVSCLVVTATSPKFFSTGLDLDWVMSVERPVFAGFIKGFQTLLARLLVFPMPTVVAINGHAFAGGAMCAMAFDFRVMKEDRGFFCLPEIDIHIPLTPGMDIILQSKITNKILYRDVVLLGKRFGGKEAAKLQLVDFAEKDELSKAVEIAEKVFSKGKDRHTYGALKREMFRNQTTVLRAGEFGESNKIQSKL
ncbi:hypothetical protein DLAC_00455 [Tieghemostelium lacteum]|uniref:Enoyl-CoA hydratase n=1 Tax=Tieghemostelium lacteum TaxID=361077 RepID=A0A152AA16_TIELA|nr:hypothetical protein DLAC_00455 [Tieghemostelium lacteum]|eukprot:KYR02971.1 hypothetical protein DLAC_00455 [Tieghemostelium lacteum]